MNTDSICWILPPRILKSSRKQSVFGVRIRDWTGVPSVSVKFSRVPGVIDETGGHDETALFVHQKKAPVADASVVAIVTEFELLRAAEAGDRDDLLQVGIVGGLQIRFRSGCSCRRTG